MQILKLGSFFGIFLLLMSTVAQAQESRSVANENLASDPSTERLWSILVFGGRLNSGDLADVLTIGSDVPYTDTNFAGVAISREFWRNDWISLEAEVGAGQQFGGLPGNDTAQVWGAGFLRYHNFPWNHLVRTSVAASIGVNYAFEKTDYENGETNGGNTKRLQHYFTPEIAFSLPEHPQAELVFRVHHRSSVWGLFGCDGCGSNVPSVGFRYRF